MVLRLQKYPATVVVPMSMAMPNAFSVFPGRTRMISRSIHTLTVTFHLPSRRVLGRALRA